MGAQHDDQPVSETEVVADELKPGTELLHGQFVIDRFLNAGGFGVTYLARDSLDRVVVIKECFPSSMCCRTASTVRARSKNYQKEFETIVRLFGQEARRLSKLTHPNIVGIHQVFEDNGTAYMALDFVEGKDLLDVIEDPRATLGPVEIKEMLLKVLSAIDYVHKFDVLHRDISPDNILVDNRMHPVLIDFGAAREEATRASRVLSALHVVKDGYSPQEFYVAGAKQNASSDLYSLGATFYHVITGEAPPNSQARVSAIAAGRPDPYEPLFRRIQGHDDYMLRAIDKALQVFPQDRIQSADEWIEMVDTERRKRAALQRAQNDQAMVLNIQKLVDETNKAVTSDMTRKERRAHKAEQAEIQKTKKKVVTHQVAPRPKSEPDPRWADLSTPEEDMNEINPAQPDPDQLADTLSGAISEMVSKDDIDGVVHDQHPTRKRRKSKGFIGRMFGAVFTRSSYRSHSSSDTL